LMIFSMALESANRSLTPNELLRGLQRVGQLPETTEGQRIGNQIDALMIFMWPGRSKRFWRDSNSEKASYVCHVERLLTTRTLLCAD
jgi:hypothetical protein